MGQYARLKYQAYVSLIAWLQVRYVSSLEIGEPDFQTPKRIKEAAIIAIEENRTRYTHNAGLRKLRKLILEYVETRYNQTYFIDEVIVTTGASEAIVRMCGAPLFI